MSDSFEFTQLKTKARFFAYVSCVPTSCAAIWEILRIDRGEFAFEQIIFMIDDVFLHGVLNFELLQGNLAGVHDLLFLCTGEVASTEVQQ